VSTQSVFYRLQLVEWLKVAGEDGRRPQQYLHRCPRFDIHAIFIFFKANDVDEDTSHRPLNFKFVHHRHARCRPASRHYHALSKRSRNQCEAGMTFTSPVIKYRCLTPHCAENDDSGTHARSQPRPPIDRSSSSLRDCRDCRTVPIHFQVYPLRLSAVKEAGWGDRLSAPIDYSSPTHSSTAFALLVSLP